MTKKTLNTEAPRDLAVWLAKEGYNEALARKREAAIQEYAPQMFAVLTALLQSGTNRGHITTQQAKAVVDAINASSFPLSWEEDGKPRLTLLDLAIAEDNARPASEFRGLKG